MQRHLPPALALTSAQGLGCGVAGQAWLLAGSSFCCVVLLFGRCLVDGESSELVGAEDSEA